MKLKFFMYMAIGLFGIQLFTACQDSPFFHRNVRTDRNGWYTDSLAVFDLPQQDRSFKAKADVWVRATADYKYESLTLVATAECDGQTEWADTLSLLLYDDKGKSTGAGFPITEYHAMAKPFPIETGKSYKIRIRHIMRDNPIRGVTACGIRLSE